MKTASFYDAEGRIVGVMTGPLDCVVATGRHNQQFWVEGAGDPDVQCVMDGKLTPRPQSPATLSGLTLTELPVPCFIRIGDSGYPCTERVAELEFAQPGSYLVIVEAWPYLNKEFTVENPPL
ncbi:hypothetical protein [Achromobacter ruhlandii]|uniref:Uncharacterized protein n=1 Tax=Achromobacter ruhlandii TaxID=72557 RepID=A0A6S7E6P6_9BURK|nr:hypothetical protein [Achromobacter ruhlandii]AKP92249.1 hypothetical protein Axylo_4796 [Achromobacter xylosoxidans]MCV6795674.1 hypothetical protein [Achromobacter ruhlandii]MCV6800622.1 hypothetical protein [Achromobacter ruhlandii]MCV6807314.1 hypothetical protein [Achromobacter ruhlandii]MCV6817609.1 hypothetical protein [Achromobacter ruhlandii]